MSEINSYGYLDMVRSDILRMIPADGSVIGTVGCGRAATEAVLVDQGRSVHGVDVSHEAIETASKRLTTARVVRPDDELPFEPLSLDGLILADVIEHLPMAWERLQQLTRAVRPGGWVVISVPNMRSIDVLFQLVVRGDWPEHPLGIFDSTHLQVMTHKRVLRWASAAGLTLDEWFDSYDYRFVRRNVHRALNPATGRLLRGFLNFEVQGRFRRSTGGVGASSVPARPVHA